MDGWTNAYRHLQNSKLNTIVCDFWLQFFILLNIYSNSESHLWCAHLSGLLWAVLCHFLQFTLAHGHSPFPAVIAWGRQWRHQLSSSARLSDLAAAACLHCRLSPVCEKRLCLYLQFVRAADSPAPPSPPSPPSSPYFAPGDSSHSTSGSSVEDLSEHCHLRKMSPNLTASSQPPHIPC